MDTSSASGKGGAFRFLRRAAGFVAGALVLASAYMHMAARAYGATGPTTEAQISTSVRQALSRDYECLLLGNSRIYRGINPDLLGVTAYNFAHDNDSFNQYYYKLMLLERGGKRPRCIIMGVDYFEFSFLSDTRNPIYGRYFGDDYLKDFKAARLSRNEAMNAFLTAEFSRGFPTLVRYWGDRALGKPRPPRSYLKENGHYVAAADPGGVVTAKRESSRLSVQEDYFHKVLEYAGAHGIRPVLVLPPTRAEELASYSPRVVAEYDRYFAVQATRHGGRYLNYASSPAFGPSSFMDATHLTKAAADRFSRMVALDLAGVELFDRAREPR